MSKDEEIRNINVRRKNLLYLIHRYLNENGLVTAARALNTEARLSDEYELCDNVDLDAMYLEYASYYQLKFGKYPRILKRATKQPTPIKLEVASKRRKAKVPNPVISPGGNDQLAIDNTHRNSGPSMDINELKVTVMPMDIEANKQLEDESENSEKKSRNLESLARLREIQHGNTNASGDLLLSCHEWQSLAELVRSTIVNDDLHLTWKDIQGNTQAIEIIKEAVVTPIIYPHLFANGLKPWRSVLLHGPPGSGKTMLAKVLYAETKGKTTFFNISSSMIVSKWRGESEKLLKILFYLAQKHAPSIVFLDEIEGLTSKRDRITDHESSKRFKNELLQLMDGMEQSNTGVFVLASTNLPWEIDDAFLRRFEKKLLVELPNEHERSILISKLLPINVKINDNQMENLVKLSAYFTGDEIRLACKEIAMEAIRRITKATINGDITEEHIPLDTAFKQIKPLSTVLMDKHIKWQKLFGS